MVIKVMILADSRGANLQQCLLKYPEAALTQVLVHRGAGMVRVVELSLLNLAAFGPDLVILSAGICDVTMRDQHTIIMRLRHTSVDGIVSHALEQVMRALEALEKVGCRNVSIATYTGIDLRCYNEGTRLRTNRQRVADTVQANEQSNQRTLNDAILSINSQVIEVNKTAGMPTTWTGGAVHP